MYYVIKVISPAEQRYLPLERASLALVRTARKLRPYFHGHTIVVMTDQPIKQVMRKPEASGRMVRLAIESSKFDVRFKPRGAIKGQALADFIVEGRDTSEAVEDPPVETWEVLTDGSATTRAAGAGCRSFPPKGIP